MLTVKYVKLHYLSFRVQGVQDSCCGRTSACIDGCHEGYTRAGETQWNRLKARAI